MANEIRIRYPLLPILTLDDEYNPSTDTTISSPELADFPVVDSSHHLPIWVDRDRETGEPFLLYITAHTSAATTATVTKDHEGTTATLVPSGTKCVNGLTNRDFIHVSEIGIYNSGDIAVTSASFTEYITAIRRTIQAHVGDIVSAVVGIRWTSGGSAVIGQTEIISNPAGTPVQWSGLTPGVSAIASPIANNTGLGSEIFKMVISDDLGGIDEGTLTVGLQHCNHIAGTRNITAGAPSNDLRLMIKNYGPRINTNPSF